MQDQSPPPDDGVARDVVPLREVALVFLRIGLLSFGGGLSGWIYREIVIAKAWLTKDEFFSGMALAQIMPGTNVTNLTVIIGEKVRGTMGAAVALLSLLIGPFIAVLCLFYAYGAVADVAWVTQGIEGIAAAAIGLLLMIAVANVQKVGANVPGLLAFAATFIAVGLLRWPLVPVVIGVGIPSIIASALKRRV